MKHFIIGCGGIGGHLVDILRHSEPGPRSWVLVDGDVYDETNLGRQPSAIPGQPKVEVLARILEAMRPEDTVTPVYDFLPTDNMPEPSAEDVIWCCVDNNKGRQAAYEMSFRNKPPMLIIMANEVQSAEALVYPKPGEINWPELLTDWQQDDAPVPEVSCTANPERQQQTYLSNLRAAVFGVSLYQSWYAERANYCRKHLEYKLGDPGYVQIDGLSPAPARVQGNLVNTTYSYYYRS